MKRSISSQINAAKLGLTLLGLLCLASGCSTDSPFADISLKKKRVYTPNNFSTSCAPLPHELRRVAVLPISSGTEEEAIRGRELLQPVLQTELSRTKRFELVWVSPDQLRTWTGRPYWSAFEPLPPKLAASLREHLGCDGVLFAELTRFKAYPPLAVGWNFKLVDLRSTEVIWAADEVFDANDFEVANAACAYQSKHSALPSRLADSRTILMSPTGFGQYSVEALVMHLPARSFN
jgi:hypothetical protein